MSMSVVESKKIEFLEDSCKKIQQEPYIRFAGVISPTGYLIAGGFARDILPYVDRNQEHMMYMQLILEMKMRKDFDRPLGKVEYMHSQREKTSMISVPLGRYVVLVVTEPDVDAGPVASMVKNEFIELQIADTNLKPNP